MKVSFNANREEYATFKKKCIDLRTTPTAIFVRVIRDVINGKYPIK